MYGQVVLAFDRELEEYVAIKMIPRGRGLSKMMEREIFSHRTCSAHPHVIAFHRVFLTKRYDAEDDCIGHISCRHLCIAMEYAAGGDLFEYAKQHGAL